MTNDNYKLPYNKRKELQRAFRNFLTDLNLPFFMTINFNVNNRPKPLSPEEAKKILNKFHRNLDRRLLGRKFYRVARNRRTFFVAMPEHLNSNLHYHLLVRIPPIPEYIFLSAAAYELYQLVPSATLQLTKLASKTDVRMTSFYSCKDLIQEATFENFVISTEFQSTPKIERENGMPPASSKR